MPSLREDDMRIDKEDLEVITARPGYSVATVGKITQLTTFAEIAAQSENQASTDGIVVRKPNKYHAQPTIVNGIRYASKKEAQFAAELDLRKKAGEVSFWLRQVPFDLTIGRYFLDFMVFTERFEGMRGQSRPFFVEYVEIKGRDLPMGKRKRLETEKLYGIHITVV